MRQWDDETMRRVSHLPENIQPLQAHPHFLALWKSPFTMYAASLQALILNSQRQFPSPISLSLWQLPVAWLIGHRPAILVPHLQLILEGVWSGGFGRAVAPFQPEGLVAEGGALQAGRRWGEGFRLQLKGVTEGASSQAVQGLYTEPERRGMKRVMPVSQCRNQY